MALPTELVAEMAVEETTSHTLDYLARRAAVDETAFDQLVGLCLPRLHRWALVATGDPDDADDVVQETLLRMHGSLAGFRGDCRFTTWLYRLMRSACGDFGRRASSLRRLREHIQEKAGSQSDQATPVPNIDNLRTAELVRYFWEELPPRQRQVLDLSDFQGCDAGEVAEMLGIEAVSVRAHLCKARRTIRRRILECARARVEERQ